MLPIIFALVTFFGWGIGDVFNVISSRRLNGASTAFWTTVIGLALSLPYAPFVLKDLNGLTPFIFFLSLLVGALLNIGWVTFNEAFAKGNPPVVGVISGSFPALVVILSVILFKEILTTAQLIAIFVIFIGNVLSMLDIELVLQGKVTFDKSVKLALISLIAWGIGLTIVKIPAQAIGWYWSNMATLVVGTGIYFYTKLRRVKLFSPLTNKSLVFLFCSSVLVTTATFSYNFAITRGLASIVAPIAGSYPALFVILAFIIFKDPIRKQQLIGIITTVLGIVLLSFFSV